MHVRCGVVRSRVCDRFGRRIHADRGVDVLCDKGKTIAGAASNVERAAVSISPCEGVTRGVFGPEVVVDFARNDALAGKFDHSAAAPAEIRALTSTRQGK